MPRLCVCAGVCKQDGAGWCPEKDDCQQFPSPCPDIDKGWYMGNATHMPTGSFWPDTNQHEGYCSARPPLAPFGLLCCRFSALHLAGVDFDVLISTVRI